MAQNRTCNLSVTGRPSSPLRHVFKVPPDLTICIYATKFTSNPEYQHGEHPEVSPQCIACMFMLHCRPGL
jgi:hypothetical protein